MNIFTRKPKNPIVRFLICGTQKGGTSALDSYLRKHPAICMAREKEVHFFDNEELFAARRPDYSVYHSFFEPESDQRLAGEATPIYMYWEPAAKRIWEYNPGMKIIVILRNPIDRAYSHWNMERSRNADLLPFWDAIRNEPDRCREALPFQHRVYSYIDRGFYTHQLRRLWHYFSKERVLILRNESLRERPAETLNTVCGFLGTAPFAAVENQDVFSIPYESGISSEARDYLRFVFEHEIRELERTLGWDCSRWLANP